MKPTSTTAAPGSSDDAPELTRADLGRARFRVSGQDATKDEWAEAVRARVERKRIELSLDTPIIEHFKALAGEDGYQDAINEALWRLIHRERGTRSI
jgi:uncharacterized protein (DUF4415 family)